MFNQIQFYDNVIPVETLKACNDFIEKGVFKFGWRSHVDIPFGHWNLEIAKGARDSRIDVTKELPKEFKQLWDHINQTQFGGKAYPTRCYANKYTFGTEGFIHSDTDMDDSVTALIYLTPDWKSDWYGETTFYTKDKQEIIQAITPKYGRLAVFPGCVFHAGRAVSKLCPKEKTSLIFKAILPEEDAKEIKDKVEDKLFKFIEESGAFDNPHKYGSLGHHLMRCFYLLREYNAGDVLSLAGGLHSIYGTNAYKKKTLPWNSTLVSDLFGPEVDKLARLFSKINRPWALENPDGTLDANDLFMLRCIECVNLYDQQELDSRFPNLKEFAVQFGGLG